MSTLPAFVNAIFTLNKKGEYILYEGKIENGYTRVSITTNTVSGGYSARYYKVKQIIAFNDHPAIKQSFDIPSQEFAYRMIERAIIEQVAGGNNESGSIPVIVTGQQTKNNTSVAAGVAESQDYTQDISNSNNSYKSVVAAQSRKLNQTPQSRIISEEEVFGNTSFNDLSFATGTSSSLDQEFTGGVKIANMSSFTDGSTSNRAGNKTSGYDSLESMLDSGF